MILCVCVDAEWVHECGSLELYTVIGTWTEFWSVCESKCHPRRLTSSA